VRAEEPEYARVAMAWGLGAIGDDRDAPALLATIDAVEDPFLDGMAAVAWTSRERSVRRRRAGPRDDGGPSAARAAAIEAAGPLLSRSPGLVLHEASRRTNYAVMPRWLRSALTVTL